jgi:hypothetical protein
LLERGVLQQGEDRLLLLARQPLAVTLNRPAQTSGRTVVQALHLHRPAVGPRRRPRCKGFGVCRSALAFLGQLLRGIPMALVFSREPPHADLRGPTGSLATAFSPIQCDQSER